MKYGQFDIEDQVYHDMKAKGMSPKPCSLCGKVLLAVRDLHKPAYCINCENKKSRLARYTNPGYSPTQEERDRIFAKDSFKRAGN